MNMKVKTQAEVEAEAAKGGDVDEVVIPPSDDISVDEDVNLEEGHEWGELLDELDATPDDTDDETPPEPPAGDEVDETPPQEVADAETPPKDDEVPPAPTDEVTPPDVPVPVEEPPAAPSEEEQQVQIEEAREKARTDLLQRFSMTAEEGETLVQKPHEELPKLAAKMTMDIFDMVLNAVHQQVPGIVQNTQNFLNAKQAAEQAFFNAWPKLANKEYLPTIQRIGEAYRKNNPNIDTETYIKEVGAQSWVALRLPIEELVALTGGAVQPPQTPATPPHTPAGPGGGTVTPIKPDTPTNDFTALAEELIADGDM